MFKTRDIHIISVLLKCERIPISLHVTNGHTPAIKEMNALYSLEKKGWMAHCLQWYARLSSFALT